MTQVLGFIVDESRGLYISVYQIFFQADSALYSWNWSYCSSWGKKIYTGLCYVSFC